jgi:hypothetical protein
MAIAWTKHHVRNGETRNSYENRVLSVEYNKTVQVMSDIWAGADYALVWDDESNTAQNICVNLYDMNPSDWKPAKITVDATDEVRAKYRKMIVDRTTQRRVEDEEFAAKQIQKGCIAKVVKGRNGKGTVGKVVVVMDAAYRAGWRSHVEKKLGIATSDIMYKKALPNGKIVDAHKDMVWVWARNAVRLDVPTVDRDAIRREVEQSIKV